MYDNCIFPSLGLYSLAYIRPHIVYVINRVFIYTKSQIFLHGIRAGSLIFFFPLLSRYRHYNHRIASFSDEHLRLPSYNLFYPVNTTI